MKSLYVMIGVCVLLLVFCTGMARMLITQVEAITLECDVLIDAAEREDMERAQQAASTISAMIDEHKKIWHLLANHDDLILIDAVMADVHMAIHYEDMQELHCQSMELRRALLIMSNKEHPNLRNVL